MPIALVFFLLLSPSQSFGMSCFLSTSEEYQHELEWPRPYRDTPNLQSPSLENMLQCPCTNRPINFKNSKYAILFIEQMFLTQCFLLKFLKNQQNSCFYLGIFNVT